MKRFGLCCLPGRGHLYPAAALGRELRRRGHEVTFFNSIITRGFVKSAGLNFRELKMSDRVVPAILGRQCSDESALTTLTAMYIHANSVLKSAYSAIGESKLDALLVDQADLASGSVADALGLPFLSLSFFPPVYTDDMIPPFVVGWRQSHTPYSRVRVRRANALFRASFSPVLDLVNEYRRVWNLPTLRGLNEAFSRRAIISQMPKALELPGTWMPPHVRYTNLFDDHSGRREVPFPWEQLNGKPLIYASMGTVRNGCLSTFEIIAKAVAGLDAQLVISLGGTHLTPSDVPRLPNDPIVVHYAPQIELLARSVLTICHGGMNTCLESLSSRVPMIVIPVADDQPGVAARIKAHGVGLVIPHKRLSVRCLSVSVQRLLSTPKYKIAVNQLQDKIATVDGVRCAADIVEEQGR